MISKQDGKLLIEDATTTKKSCIPIVFNESVHNIKTVSSVQPWVDDVNRWIVGTLKNGFDIFFHNRDYARFYALEKIARSPYMGYVFVLVRDKCTYVYYSCIWMYNPFGFIWFYTLPYCVHITALHGNAGVI